MSERATTEKPLYHVPTMVEIEALPWNGRTVVSTFSGCGGSCLGYRMAGFRVAWASEFIPAAQDVYRLNHPTSTLDTRDIRTVQPEDILAATGLAVGEIDVLDGSPPCASFSTAGKRERGWGQVKAYSDTSQRTDDLFFEFTRLLSALQPRTFVAENVSGLVKGTAKGYFKEILGALKAAGYAVEARVLDAQWLGVPQMRERLIFVGVRQDLVDAYGMHPAHPRPLPYRYTIRDACPWIEQVVHDTSGTFSQGPVGHRPSPCITTGVGGLNAAHHKVYSEVGPVPEAPPVEKEAWFTGYSIEPLWRSLQPGQGHPKRFNLVRGHPDRPVNCLTQMAGVAGAAGPAHPHEPRKYSIAEVRRLCGFPDDFQLVGPYAKQWERMARAVPPVMMAAVARVLRDDILSKMGPVSAQPEGASA